MGKGNVRLIDIAEVLGLTVNTVSRALRDMPDIGEETKIRVREMAENMGYIPNSIASSLRSGMSHIIAIVFDNMKNPYFMIMADKIHQRLYKLGYATMIFAVHDIKFKMNDLTSIISRKVDAIITFLEPDQRVVRVCQQNNIPLLLFGRENSELDIDSVSTDDFKGGYEVGRLFSKLGAKNIGYIGAPKEIECSVRRLNGMKHYLDEHHIPYDESNFRFIKDIGIEEELNALIDSKVDAIFCFNDVMALEAITLLEKHGLNVPDDVHVVGYDNIQHEFFIPIELTSVDSDKEKIVDTVVDLILDRVDNKSNHKPRQIKFDVWMHEGRT